MEYITTVNIVGEDISSAALLATYTATEDMELFANVYLEGIAGGGIYNVYITKQRGGIGSEYQASDSTVFVNIGSTTLYLPSTPIPTQEDDVIKIYAVGLAGDIAVNGYVELFNGAYDDSLSSLVTLLTNISTNLKQYSVLRRQLKCDQIEIRRSTDASVEVHGVGSLAGRSALYFTVKYMKEKDSATDAQSVIQIEETAGLLYINKTAASVPANGSITVTDALAGTMTIELSASETDKLLPNERYVYDIKVDNDVVAEGTLLVTTAVTRTIT